MGVDFFQRPEEPGELPPRPVRHSPCLTEVALPQLVGARYHCGPHGTVFVRSAYPHLSILPVEPQCKPHGFIVPLYRSHGGAPIHTRTMLLQEKNLESYLQRGMQIDLTQPSDPAWDKRREPRYPVSKTGIVHPVHPTERDRLQAYVMDLSSSGMKLRVERPLDPGTQLQVLLEDVIIFGEVRHCTESAGRYNIGVLVLDVLSPLKRKRK